MNDHDRCDCDPCLEKATMFIPEEKRQLCYKCYRKREMGKGMK